MIFNRLKLAFIAFICAGSSFAQTWTNLESGTTNDLRGVHFPTAEVGFAVGWDGTILKTENEGELWNSLTSSYDGYNFWDVHFVTTEIGYVVGESDPGTDPNGIGIVLKTVDGGENWEAVFNGTIEAPQPMRDLFVIDENILFACGGAESTDGKVLRSVDGGSSWGQIGATFYHAFFSGMYFLNENKGFVSVYESVYGSFNPGLATFLSTTDGAAFSSEVIASSAAYFHASTDFPTSAIGYSSRSEVIDNVVYIRKTIDGGESWDESAITGFSGSIYSLDFIDSEIGYLVGGNPSCVILTTTDGGATWEEETNEEESIMHAVYFENANLGFAVGKGGSIIKRKIKGTNVDLVDFENTKISPVIYPNPFMNNAMIMFGKELEGDHYIVIHDLLGKEVYRSKNIEGSMFEIKKEEIGNAGIYVLSLNKNDENTTIYSSKIIIE